MKTRFSSRCDIALVGFAQSPVYRRAPMSLGALTLDTCVRAIEDAGLQRSQIDGLSTGPLLPAASDHTNIDGVDIVTSNFVAEHMGIRPRWYNNFQGIGQINSSVIQATNALAAGGADYVLLHRSLRNPPGRYHGNPLTRATEASQWTAPYGLWGPTPIALLYNEYMHRYGATREDMATLVVTLRENVANNPLSYWKNQTITREDYLDSRPIADPITILDCDIPVDFAASFILTTAERAGDLKHKPVYLAGYAQSQPGYRRAFRTLDDLMQVGRETSKILWENSGLGPADVDVPQTYDGFSAIDLFLAGMPGFLPRWGGGQVHPGAAQSTSMESSPCCRGAVPWEAAESTGLRRCASATFSFRSGRVRTSSPAPTLGWPATPSRTMAAPSSIRLSRWASRGGFETRLYLKLKPAPTCLGGGVLVGVAGWGFPRSETFAKPSVIVMKIGRPTPPTRRSGAGRNPGVGQGLARVFISFCGAFSRPW